MYLSSELEHAVIFLLILQHDLTFANAVRQWFFTINIFTCLEGECSNRCMPVVGCGDCDRIDVFHIEHATEVANELCFTVGHHVLQLLECSVEMIFINIAKGNDLHAGEFGKPVHVVVAHTTETDVSDPDGVAWCGLEK